MKQDREQDEPRGARANTDSSHAKIIKRFRWKRDRIRYRQETATWMALVSYRIASINRLRVQAALKRLTNKTS